MCMLDMAETLMIRNLQCLVSVQERKETSLRRNIQEPWRFNTQKTLEAACDRYRLKVDANDVIEAHEYSDGFIARIQASGFLHSHLATRDD